MTRGAARWLDADGVRVHAVEWRPRSSGGNGTATDRRVLLVHGLGANTLSWEPVGQPLADQLEATVTAIDLVGFGRTRAPERAATLATNGRLVTAVLEQQGPAVVFGNSMGATLGATVTARRPELVDGLVLVNPAVPHPRPGLGDWLRLVRLAPVMVTTVGHRVIGTRARLIGPERLVASSLELCLTDPGAIDPELRGRLVALAAERYRYPEAAPAYADAARSLFRHLVRGIHDDLAVAAPARPTLLVHGALDRLVPLAAAREAARRHPLDLEVLDGIGHAPQLEAPGRFVEVVTPWLGARITGWQDQGRARAAAGASSRSPSGSSSPS